jgi:PAS domain S-box-containing protein
LGGALGLAPPFWLQAAWYPSDFSWLTLAFAAGLIAGLAFAYRSILRQRLETAGRQALEAAHRKSEERLAAALRAGKLGVYDHDLVTGCLQWDRTVRGLWGVSDGEMVNYRTCKEGIHPGDLAAVKEAIKRSFDPAGSHHYECEYRVISRADGAVRWVFADGDVTFEAGKPIRLVGIVQDITPRKQAETAQRQTEERFRGIFEHSLAGIAIADWDGYLQQCNPAFCSLLGYPEHELLGKHFSSISHPGDREADIEKGRRLRSGETAFEEMESRYLHRSGQTVWVRRVISALPGKAGQPSLVFALVIDITGRRRAEEQIRLLLREVNHRSKNMLALVQAVARQTVAANPQDFIGRFEERIQALAASQDLLVKSGGWSGVELEALVRSQLAHFKDLVGTRIALQGPRLIISASAAQIVGMALHELATNAGKYGALSARDGRVEVAWSLERGDAGQETFAIDWRESGGPPVAEPKKRGFGSTVLCTLAERSLDANVQLDFAPAGLVWRLRCPAAEAVDKSQRATEAVL